MSIGGIRSDHIQFDPMSEASPNSTVRGVQQALNRLPGEAGLREDGIFDAPTSQALRRFQHTAGLEVSGAINPPTLEALNKAVPQAAAATAESPAPAPGPERAPGGEGLRHDHGLQGAIARSRLDLQTEIYPKLQAEGFPKLQDEGLKYRPPVESGHESVTGKISELLAGSVLAGVDSGFMSVSGGGTPSGGIQGGPTTAPKVEPKKTPGADLLSGGLAEEAGWAGGAAVFSNGKHYAAQALGGVGNTFNTEGKVDYTPPTKEEPKKTPVGDLMGVWKNPESLAGPAAGVWAQKFQAEASASGEGGMSSTDPHSEKGPPKLHQPGLASGLAAQAGLAQEYKEWAPEAGLAQEYKEWAPQAGLAQQYKEWAPQADAVGRLASEAVQGKMESPVSDAIAPDRLGADIQGKKL